jgi:hypothetical protein
MEPATLHSGSVLPRLLADRAPKPRARSHNPTMSDRAASHLAAAARHELAASTHERAAKFWEAQGDRERAELQREMADCERHGAGLERRWGELAEPRLAHGAAGGARHTASLIHDSARRLSLILSDSRGRLRSWEPSLTSMPRGERRLA